MLSGGSIKRLACLIALAGCSGGRPTFPIFSATDSAGVRVAVSGAPSWTPDTQWHLADSPRVAVGVAEGEDEYLVSWIWDALLLGDGSLVIGNAGGHDLRWYDGAGRFVRKAGREGAGPGEFHGMADLRMWRLPNGELGVRDAPISRVNVFDSAGAFRRTVMLAPPDSAARPSALGAFSDGTYLAIAWELDERASPGTISHAFVQYVRYDTAGHVLGTVLRAETAPHMAHQLNGVMHFPYLPFTVEPQVAVDSASVLILRRGQPVIERYDLSGRLVGRIEWSPPRRPVTRELYLTFARADIAVAQGDQQKRLWQDYYDQKLPLPDFAPAYQGLQVDETHHLWVERYRMPGEAERIWDVIAPDGRWLGPVKLPGRFWLHRAGATFLVGTQMDSLDVERVQVYDLRRDH